MVDYCDVSLLDNSTGVLTDEILSKSIECVFGSQETDVIKAVNMMNQQILPTYSEKTNTMLLMNNSYNSTSYVKDDLLTKKTDVERMNQSARRDIHKVRYAFLQKRRQAAYYRFMSGVIQSLIVICALAAILVAFYKLDKLTPKMLTAGIMTMVALFLVVIAVIIKNNLTRRPDDWNKFYFTPNNPTTQ